MAVEPEVIKTIKLNMSRDISIFADYHQKENSLSNYCGLLMKLIYQESPKRFEELLSTLVLSDEKIIVGPIFTQQTKESRGIPDLSITQRSFSIFFETKRYDWFYEDQITRHMASFDRTTRDKILFLLSNFEDDNLSTRFALEITEAKKHNIILQPLSFEGFVGALAEVCNTEYLKSLLDEFKIYLDRNGYLPKWKYLLDVVNCAASLHEIDQNVYFCPDTGGAYSHRRAKYFGPYAEKQVSQIFEIRAIVVVEQGLSNPSIKWNNSGENTHALINEAINKINLWPARVNENVTTPLQVFLLSTPYATNFRKGTSGGMFQSKTYFWDIAIDCKNALELALKLDGNSWNDFY